MIQKKFRFIAHKEKHPHVRTVPPTAAGGASDRCGAWWCGWKYKILIFWFFLTCKYWWDSRVFFFFWGHAGRCREQSTPVHARNGRGRATGHSRGAVPILRSAWARPAGETLTSGVPLLWICICHVNMTGATGIQDTRTVRSHWSFFFLQQFTLMLWMGFGNASNQVNTRDAIYSYMTLESQYVQCGSLVGGALIRNLFNLATLSQAHISFYLAEVANSLLLSNKKSRWKNAWWNV